MVSFKMFDESKREEI